ncbi:fluoride efflux transporter CrcB [Ligilactobacillus saerimneri]|uniref:Fluoride-specific ion channel FluC n=1 Tax=Ligilactobacillus saerimneri 30a TaxID=1227363 RepID=M5J7G2_9LACO|nr:fluoride efflux transporter CrcB [Ligilactobacillus saerimneri]EKW99622.1 putative CrcB-like protein [Ligilactobacillus saerimneri 30a]
MTYLWICLGASCGSAVRYLIATWFKTQRWGQTFPYATLIVNLTGAWSLGVLAHHLVATSSAYLLLGTGFMGGYTTFSTMNLELWLQAKSKKWGQLVPYLLLTYGGGVLLAWWGYLL